MSAETALLPAKPPTCDRKCSDHDDECWEVKDPLACWLGGEVQWGNEIRIMPVADGYCPILRGLNARRGNG